VIEVAVVGYGYWGPNLVRNFTECERTRVSVCCDVDPDRLARARRRFPSVEGVTDFEEVLRRPSVRAVALATPVHTHYELARRALEAGKHVLVEKPFTTRVEDAEALCALARRQGLVLMVDHVFVYSPAVLKMKELVDSGKLGRLFFIDSVRINLGLFQHDVNVVWDLAAHDLSIVDFLLGRSPRSLSAMGGAHAGQDIEDVAYLNLDYGEGLLANFHVNWLSPVKIRQMIVGGSERSILYNDVDESEKIKVYDRGIDVGDDPDKRHELLIAYRSGDVWAPRVSGTEPLARLAAHFAECIDDGMQPVTDGESGLRIVRILDAAQRSIKAEGQRITL
jgi:predicted dehydrogenase